MARVGLYIYIVVLYQNAAPSVLRKRNGPVREKRRGLFGLVAVPAERACVGSLCVAYALSGSERSRWLYVVLDGFGVTSQNIMVGYFMQYNTLKASRAICYRHIIYRRNARDFMGNISNMRWLYQIWYIKWGVIFISPAFSLHFVCEVGENISNMRYCGCFLGCFWGVEYMCCGVGG